MPIKFCENIPKVNHDMKYTISYNKTISDNNLVCSYCHTEMNNNKDIYGKNVNEEDESKKKYNKCFYLEKEKNICCLECYNKMKQ